MPFITFHGLFLVDFREAFSNISSTASDTQNKATSSTSMQKLDLYLEEMATDTHCRSCNIKSIEISFLGGF